MFFKAIFLLVGTTIGAGFFSLPYAFSLSGPLVSVLGLIGLTAITLIINFFYARTILKTKGDHQLPGYAKRWLGAKGQKLALLAIVLSTSGALFAYIILGGDFLSLYLNQPPSIHHSLLFFLIGSIFILRGIKSISKVEEVLTLVLVLLAIAIPLSGAKFFQMDNLKIIPTSKLAFYGPVLFSLSGLAVIPEIEEVVRSKRKLLIRVVILGTIIPAIVYLVFGLGVFLISGAATTADALSGLVAWSPKLVKAGAFIGILATFTSFISLSNVLKEVYYRDIKTSPKLATLLALVPSFAAVFASSRWFLKVISLTGSVTIGLSGIVVCLFSLKANGEKSWHKPILYIAGLVLLLGMTTPFWK
jgi:amino acid permease